MPDVNLAPFDAQQAAIDRRRQLAQALLQQGLSPMQMPQVAGAKVSPLEGIARLVQALSGKIGNNQADKQQSALSAAMQTDKSSKNSALTAALLGKGQDPSQNQAIADALGGDNAQQDVAKTALAQALIGQREAALPKPIDPNSQEGIAAAIAKSQGEYHPPQNIDPLSQQGQSAQINVSQGGYHPPIAPRNIDPLSQEGIAAQTAVSQGSYHAPVNPPAPRNIDPLSPEGIAAQLKIAEGKKPPDMKPEMQGEMVDKALGTVQYLTDNLTATGGGQGAVGARGPSSLFGALANPLPGTQAANYVSYVDSLKSQLTLPNLDILKGLGRVTDREFKTLADAMTALNRNMSEDQFKKELGTIKDTLNNIKLRKAPAPTASSVPAGVDPAVWNVMTPEERKLWQK